MPSKIATDMLGNQLSPGMVIAFAEERIQRIGVVSQLIGSHGNAIVTFYRTLNAKTITNRQSVRNDQLNSACVVISIEGSTLDFADELAKHSDRLKKQLETVGRIEP